MPSSFRLFSIDSKSLRYQVLEAHAKTETVGVKARIVLVEFKG